MTSYAVGSQMPYYYSIYRELPLNDNQQISISLENKGWGLLTNDDIITVTMPYEYILVGRYVQ